MEQDADVRRFVGGYPRTREDAERKFQNNLKPVQNRLAMWAAVFKPTGKYIGRCGLYPHFNHDGQPVPGEASLGLYFAKKYWGRGLATEAGNGFIQFGFSELKLNRIVAMVEFGNEASVHLLKKLGFRLTFKEISRRSFYHFELVNPARFQ